MNTTPALNSEVGPAAAPGAGMAVAPVRLRSLDAAWAGIMGCLNEAAEGPIAEAGVMVRLQAEEGSGGWVLPLADLAGTAVPGPIARSAHAPPAILGITGLRGRVLTVVDARQLLTGHPATRPQEGWLTLLSPRWGDGWALLWPELVGLRPRAGWTEHPRPSGAPDWMGRVWRDQEGAFWREFLVSPWATHWTGGILQPVELDQASEWTPGVHTA